MNTQPNGINTFGLLKNYFVEEVPLLLVLFLGKRIMCYKTSKIQIPTNRMYFSCSNPFDVVKVRLQTMPETYSSPVKCFKDIVKYEGVSGLYKGMVSPFFAQFVMGALSFAGNSVALSVLEPNLQKEETASSKNSFLAGSFGGFLQCFVLVPADLIKCKMQVDHVCTEGHSTASKYSSSFDCARQVIKAEGIAGLYRGMLATTCREVPAFGLYFATYSVVSDFLSPPPPPSTAPVSASSSSSSSGSTAAAPAAPATPISAILVAGGLAGCASWAAVYPVDVIKSNLQIGTFANDPKYANSMWGVTKALYHKYGLKIFSRGLGTTIARAFPVNAGVFYFYELFRDKVGL